MIRNDPLSVMMRGSLRIIVFSLCPQLSALCPTLLVVVDIFAQDQVSRIPTRAAIAFDDGVHHSSSVPIIHAQLGGQNPNGLIQTGPTDDRAGNQARFD